MRRSALAVVAMLALAGSALAGGGPHHVVVLVNDASPESLEVASAYREARAIPDGNFVHLRFAPKDEMPAAEFETTVLVPLRAALAARGLAGRARYVVVTQGFPYRIGAEGYKVAVSAAVACLDASAKPIHVNPFAGQSYAWYEATTAFRGARGLPYLGTALMGDTVADVRRCIAQGAAADGTRPSGTIYLFEGVGPRQRLLSGPQGADQLAPTIAALATLGIKAVQRPEHSLKDEQDVLGYFTGFTHVNVEKLRFLPGALADHLTSFGGIIRGKSGQMPITKFIAAGATGSYGTVEEPTNVYLRFPQAWVFERYAAGFTLAESYWMSVGDPRIGLVLGDPLAAPWAVAPEVAIGGAGAKTPLSGSATLTLSAHSKTKKGLQAIEAWLDGRPWPGGPSLRAAAGTTLRLRVGAATGTHVVAEGETTPVSLAALAAALPADAPARAVVLGDTLTLTAATVGPEGNGIAFSCTAAAPAAAAVGDAFAVPLGVGPESGTLAGGAPTRQIPASLDLILGGKPPAPGDRVTITVGDTSVRVAAEAGDDVRKFVLRLLVALAESGAVGTRTPAELDAVRASGNPNPAPLPVQYDPRGERFGVELRSTAVAEAGNGTKVTIEARLQAGTGFTVQPVGASTMAGGETRTFAAQATIRASLRCPVLERAPLTLDTSALADGHHRLRLAVEEDDAVAACGFAEVDLVVAKDKGRLDLRGPTGTVTGPFDVTPRLVNATRGGSLPIRLLVDGRDTAVIAGHGRSARLDPAAIPLGRGVHSLMAELQEKDGTVLMRSAPLTFAYDPPAPPAADPPKPAKPDEKPGKGKGGKKK